jgi:hypothetical protein
MLASRPNHGEDLAREILVFLGLLLFPGQIGIGIKARLRCQIRHHDSLQGMASGSNMASGPFMEPFSGLEIHHPGRTTECDDFDGSSRRHSIPQPARRSITESINRPIG